MWRKVVDWYREWEDEQLAVLEQPGLADQAPAGYRRYAAKKLAELSLVERQQLRGFGLKYRGRLGFIAFCKLLLAFSLCGVVLHLALRDEVRLSIAIVVANLFGLSLVIGVAGAWFNYRKMVNQKLRTLLVGGGLLGGTVGLGAVIWTGGKSLAEVLAGLPPVFVAAAPGVALLAAAPLVLIGVLRNRQYEALTVQLQRDAERERLARELSESQLRLLRAQIEPHFLFNTLGAVQQLAEHGAPRAAQLTANLIAFLRASSAEMRSEQVSLGVEFGLVEAYLRVMQERLGSRLHFTLTLPDSLAQVRVPSMILLTLVENSIKHGIEPSLRGGEIALSAEVLGELTRIRVHDSGNGMSATPGAGLGLDNVRHRLRLAYGEPAGLVLHDADPGLIAEITIPNQAAQA